MESVKIVLVWSGLLVTLDYPQLFAIILHIVLSVVHYEYQELFKKICSSQTGAEEEVYIALFSSSMFPYVIIQGILFAASVSVVDPERLLCLGFLLSVVSMVTIRINQYSAFCIEVTDAKRKKDKEVRSKDTDS